MHKSKTYPFTIDQLKYFRTEIREAGGFDELMLKKEALKQDGEFTMIMMNKE